jgi:zinc/manganese transport system substrate-binding protein
MGAFTCPRHRLRFVLVALAALLGAGCARSHATRTPVAIGVESQYADVLAQVGGPYVTVRAILNNPNTDPHAFEASPRVAREVAGASLVVMNGLGYDAWIERIMAATPNPHRRVIDVRTLLGLRRDTVNPHLWYDPRTMPAVAEAAAQAFAALDPPHAAYFRAHAQRFVASLEPWKSALAALRSGYPGTPVAVVEPVANALLEAAGWRNLTPLALQLAVMNGTDPAPQDVAAMRTLLRRRAVKVLLYNQQVTGPLTASFLQLAIAAHIPVVGVYETMPQPGFDYQSWMLAETQALQAAVAHGVSTRTLGAEPPR